MNKQSDFIRLIREHEGVIYKVSRVYFDQEEDQKDLYQEIVYQLWRSYDSFDERSKWSTWMYRVALNTAISYLKRAKSKVNKVSSERLDNFKMEPFDPVMEERIEWLYKSIQTLSVIEKGIILLYLEGKPHEEIASITGFSTSNVGTRISRIKEKLKRQISK
ncbi:MAG: sigma-70 family RNA polymerase sigma factor [Lutimonas sp.]